MSGTGRVVFPEVRVWPGDPPKGPGRVGGPSREVRDGSGDSFECPRWVKRGSERSGTGRVVLPEVRVWLGDPLKGPGRVGGHSRSLGQIGGPSGGLRRIGRPFQRSRTCWGTLPEVQDGSGAPPRGLGRVEEPYWRSGSGRGTLQEVRDGSGDPPGGSGRVRNPTKDPVRVRGPYRRSELGRGTLLVLWEGAPTRPRPPGWSPDLFRTSGSVP